MDPASAPAGPDPIAPVIAAPVTPAPPSGMAADWGTGVVALAIAFVVCVLAYLAFAIPGAWFPDAKAVRWTPAALTLARGAGRIERGELVVDAPDASGITLITLTSDLRSTDYPAVAWDVSGVPENADMHLLWRSDYAPQKLNTVPVRVEAGRALPVRLIGDPDWIGRITGLALTLRGPLPQPLHVRGVTAKPMGALETVHDRAAEWLVFERWNGASINTVVGGADVQDLPLPLLLAIAVGLAVAGVTAYVHLRRWPRRAIAVAAAAAFVVAWLALDARWSFNLVRQARATAATYGGKDLRARHLASEDGALYAFVERVLRVLPEQPARVFVFSDTQYWRGRAAYHLLPHRAFADMRNSVPVVSGYMRPGDWVFVYQRKGMQFNPNQHVLRWENGQHVSADVMLVEPGAALFRVR